MSLEAKRAAVTNAARVSPPVATIDSVVAYRTLRNTVADFNGICAHGYAEQKHAERSPEYGRETPMLGVYHVKIFTLIGVFRRHECLRETCLVEPFSVLHRTVTL